MSCLAERTGSKKSSRNLDFCLRDESGLCGYADDVFFPESTAELEAFLDAHADERSHLVVQGSRTGIAGAAVPFGGTVICMERMNRIVGLRKAGESFYLIAEAGVTFETLSHCLRNRSFNCDGWDKESLCALEALKKTRPQTVAFAPSEKGATLGGAIACNASSLSGRRTADDLQAISMVLSTGKTFSLERGRFFFKEEGCTLPSGTVLPPPRRESAGPFGALMPSPGSDLIELFAGSEGTLGIFTEITVKLTPEPDACAGVFFFFGNETDAVRFGETLASLSSGSRIEALEFMDHGCLAMLSRMNEESALLRSYPSVRDDAAAAVYAEMTADSQDALMDTLEEILRLYESCGGKDDMTWAEFDRDGVESLRHFRHCAAEAANMKRSADSPGSTCKLESDFQWGSVPFSKVYTLYRDGIDDSGIPAVMFGHIRGSQLHVDFYPQTAEQADKAVQLLSQWACMAAEAGGSACGENGIGKCRKAWLGPLMSEEDAEMILKLKRCFDSSGRLNPKNTFGPMDGTLYRKADRESGVTV